MLKQCPATVCLGQMHFSEQQDLLALQQGKCWGLTVAQPVGLLGVGWSGLWRAVAPAEAVRGSPCGSTAWPCPAG